jgi:hypothetical protein
MARTDIGHKESNYVFVQVKDLTRLRTQMGSRYIPDIYVEAYEKGLPLPQSPYGMGISHNARLKEK